MDNVKKEFQAKLQSELAEAVNPIIEKFLADHAAYEIDSHMALEKYLEEKSSEVDSKLDEIFDVDDGWEYDDEDGDELLWEDEDDYWS